MEKVQRTNQNNEALPSIPVAAGLCLLCSAAVCLACYPLLKDASPFLYAVPFIISFINAFTYGHKSSFVTVNASAAALVAFTCAIQYGKFINGAKVFANELFALSEENQSYVYNMFETAEDSGGMSAQTVFALFIVYLFAVLAVHASLKRVSAIPIAFIVVYAETEIYLGIHPGALVNVLMFVAWFMLAVFCGLIGANKQQKAAFQMIAIVGVIMVAVSAAAYFLYPAEYRETQPAVHETGEKIRDYFDDSVKTLLEQLGVLPTDEEEQEAEEDEAEENEGTEDEGETQSEGETEPPPEDMNDDGTQDAMEMMQGAQAQKKKEEEERRAKIILLILLIILIYILSLVITNIVRNRKMRSKDTRKAVVYSFKRSVKWLRKTGFGDSNIPMLWRKDEIASLTFPDYASEYAAAVNAWEEALYSQDEIDEGRKEQMIAYCKRTKAAVKEINGKGKYIVYKLIKYM